MINAHYETVCTTEYYCSWVTICYNNPVVERTEGPDCSMPPSPLSGDQCHVSGGEGDVDNWYLSSSTPHQNCEEVWVDDPPPPDDGGSDAAAAFDNRIIDNLTHPCLTAIFERIKNIKAGNIGSIIDKFSGEIPSYTWTVTEGSLPANVNGQTSYADGLASTTLDYNKLRGATNIAVATTMIHEAVHGYLAIYYYTDPINFNKTYPEQMEYFIKSKNPGLNDNEHVLMAKSFVADIASAVKEFAVSAGLTSIDDQVFSDLA